MKKILIFSLSYYPHVGGAEVAIKEITDRIVPTDITFHLICNRYDSTLPKVEKKGNVLVHRVGVCSFSYVGKILFVPLAAMKAFALHRTHRFDGLWAMMLYMTFTIALMRVVGVRIPYVVSLQEGEPFGHVFERWHIKPFLPLVRYGMRHAATVQAISSFLGTWTSSLNFHGPVEIIPNGVHIAHFSQTYSVNALAKTRAELKSAAGDIVLVHVGRMVGKNGIDDIIKALTFLPPNISFVHIGAGPDEDMLKQLARTVGVADRARFLGFVAHAELPRYLQASDIFIRPSLSEGMGNAFIEAMAAGVPVIGTQVGGIADFLFDPERNPEHEPTGRAVNPNDQEGIARAVGLYLKDTDATARIIENARRLVRERYDWKRVVHDMRVRVFSHIPHT